MPKQIPKKELDDLIEIISRFSTGVSLGEILKELTLPIARRNVQHRLFFLVKNGSIQAVGNTRSRRYAIPFTNNTHGEGVVSLSKASIEIQKKICAPVYTRTYVNYNQEFIVVQSRYTQYLSDSVRKHLLELGDNGEHPPGTFAKQNFHQLLVDLSWNSSRLEGNSYSLPETKRTFTVRRTGCWKEFTRNTDDFEPQSSN